MVARVRGVLASWSALYAIGAAACGPAAPVQQATPPPSPVAPAVVVDAGAGAVAVATPATPRLSVVEPPAGVGGLDGEHVVAARLFVFADTQLHHVFGKRTFAQSPLADRASVEVAVRPAALDDGSDLLLDLFLAERAAIYPDHTPVFLGDASDVSCEQELEAFTGVLARHGVNEVLSVTSNHDGFFVGNYTSQDDLDGLLAATDMPTDWTRACAEHGTMDDHRLTKGRAAAGLAALLPDAPAWATSLEETPGPRDHRRAHLYHVRPLGGGDAGAPPVWGVFLDTADYRGFDLEASRGAGTVGAVSKAQLAFLDHAMFEARDATPGDTAPMSFVLFGHHPWNELDAASQARLRKFVEVRPEIIAYVAAHTHVSKEQSIKIGPKRALPEIVVGSTTDAPQSARLIEVHVDAAGGARAPAAASWRLDLDRGALCGDVPPVDRDGFGYLGYRLRRDDVPDLDLAWYDKLFFAVGADDLADERTAQVIGALLVENELVRAWAQLYLASPLTLADDDRAALEDLVARRYAGGADLAAIAPFVRGEAKVGGLTAYDRWDDPVIASRTAIASQAMHRFGPITAMVRRLRAMRLESEDARHYFECHALHAAAVESKAQRRKGVVFIP